MEEKYSFTCWICKDEGLAGMFGSFESRHGAAGLELKNSPTKTKIHADQKQIRITIEEMDK